MHLLPICTPNFLMKDHNHCVDLSIFMIHVADKEKSHFIYYDFDEELHGPTRPKLHINDFNA